MEEGVKRPQEAPEGAGAGGPERQPGAPTLALAFLGDAVWEILVRTHVMGSGSLRPNELNRRSSHLASAATQARIARALRGRLTEEEEAVLRRGRNAKAATSAKNASITDYRLATGLETLFGWLYHSGQTDRLRELFALCLEEEKSGS